MDSDILIFILILLLAAIYFGWIIYFLITFDTNTGFVEDEKED